MHKFHYDATTTHTQQQRQEAQQEFWKTPPQHGNTWTAALTENLGPHPWLMVYKTPTWDELSKGSTAIPHLFLTCRAGGSRQWLSSFWCSVSHSTHNSRHLLNECKECHPPRLLVLLTHGFKTSFLSMSLMNLNLHTTFDKEAAEGEKLEN